MHKFYSAFGVVTVAFARMESDLRVLISGIAFKEEAIFASAFMDRSQLGENLDILRKLGRQYWDAQENIESIVKKIERLRTTRNLFIHGVWTPGDFGKESGSASVKDLRTTFEEKQSIRSWNHSQTSTYSMEQFQTILTEVNAVMSEISELMVYLEKEEHLEFSWGGGTAISKPIFVPLDKILKG